MSHETINNFKQRLGNPIFIFVVVVLFLIVLIGFGRSM